MDIPLPDEIPLPGGVRPPRGPPRGPPPPMRQGGGMLANPRPTQILLPPGPPPDMSVPPPIFNIPPPFMTTPPPRLPGPPPMFGRMPGDIFPPPVAERYSPSRVTADDDDRDPPELPPIPSVSLPVTVPSHLTSTASISSTTVTTADVKTSSLNSTTSSTDITSSTSVLSLDTPLGTTTK
ncbi:uncharacterized protein [Procambarus clarkii]|uniref:uncharacterized protein n=1 Tax=Procambarus clarkii TaxID=6728 RepID=UPI0037438AF5